MILSSATLCLAFLTVITTANLYEDQKKILSECNQRFGVTKDAVEGLSNWKIGNTTRAVKCLIYCTLMTHGVMDGRGVVDKKKALAYARLAYLTLDLPPAQYKCQLCSFWVIIRDCTYQTMTVTDQCDSANNFVTCFVEESDKGPNHKVIDTLRLSRPAHLGTSDDWEKDLEIKPGDCEKCKWSSRVSMEQKAQLVLQVLTWDAEPGETLPLEFKTLFETLQALAKLPRNGTESNIFDSTNNLETETKIPIDYFEDYIDESEYYSDEVEETTEPTTQPPTKKTTTRKPLNIKPPENIEYFEYYSEEGEETTEPTTQFPTKKTTTRKPLNIKPPENIEYFEYYSEEGEETTEPTTQPPTKKTTTRKPLNIKPPENIEYFEYYSDEGEETTEPTTQPPTKKIRTRKPLIIKPPESIEYYEYYSYEEEITEPAKQPPTKAHTKPFFNRSPMPLKLKYLRSGAKTEGDNETGKIQLSDKTARAMEDSMDYFEEDLEEYDYNSDSTETESSESAITPTIDYFEYSEEDTGTSSIPQENTAENTTQLPVVNATSEADLLCFFNGTDVPRNFYNSLHQPLNVTSSSQNNSLPASQNLTETWEEISEINLPPVDNQTNEDIINSTTLPPTETTNVMELEPYISMRKQRLEVPSPTDKMNDMKLGPHVLNFFKKFDKSRLANFVHAVEGSALKLAGAISEMNLENKPAVGVSSVAGPSVDRTRGVDVVDMVSAALDKAVEVIDKLNPFKDHIGDNSSEAENSEITLSSPNSNFNEGPAMEENYRPDSKNESNAEGEGTTDTTVSKDNETQPKSTPKASADKPGYNEDEKDRVKVSNNPDTSGDKGDHNDKGIKSGPNTSKAPQNLAELSTTSTVAPNKTDNSTEYGNYSDYTSHKDMSVVPHAMIRKLDQHDVGYSNYTGNLGTISYPKPEKPPQPQSESEEHDYYDSGSSYESILYPAMDQVHPFEIRPVESDFSLPASRNLTETSEDIAEMNLSPVDNQTNKDIINSTTLPPTETTNVMELEPYISMRKQNIEVASPTDKMNDMKLGSHVLNFFKKFDKSRLANLAHAAEGSALELAGAISDMILENKPRVVVSSVVGPSVDRTRAVDVVDMVSAALDKAVEVIDNLNLFNDRTGDNSSEAENSEITSSSPNSNFNERPEMEENYRPDSKNESNAEGEGTTDTTVSEDNETQPETTPKASADKPGYNEGEKDPEKVSNKPDKGADNDEGAESGPSTSKAPHNLAESSTTSTVAPNKTDNTTEYGNYSDYTSHEDMSVVPHVMIRKLDQRDVEYSNYMGNLGTILHPLPEKPPQPQSESEEYDYYDSGKTYESILYPAIDQVHPFEILPVESDFSLPASQNLTETSEDIAEMNLSPVDNQTNEDIINSTTLPPTETANVMELERYISMRKQRLEVASPTDKINDMKLGPHVLNFFKKFDKSRVANLAHAAEGSALELAGAISDMILENKPRVGVSSVVGSSVDRTRAVDVVDMVSAALDKAVEVIDKLNLFNDRTGDNRSEAGNSEITSSSPNSNFNEGPLMEENYRPDSKNESNPEGQGTTDKTVSEDNETQPETTPKASADKPGYNEDKGADNDEGAESGPSTSKAPHNLAELSTTSTVVPNKTDNSTEYGNYSDYTSHEEMSVVPHAMIRKLDQHDVGYSNYMGNLGTISHPKPEKPPQPKSESEEYDYYDSGSSYESILYPAMDQVHPFEIRPVESDFKADQDRYFPDDESGYSESLSNEDSDESYGFYGRNAFLMGRHSHLDGKLEQNEDVNDPTAQIGGLLRREVPDLPSISYVGQQPLLEAQGPRRGANPTPVTSSRGAVISSWASGKIQGKIP